LTDTGTGSLTLNGSSSTFPGGLTLNGGTLNLGNNASLGTGTFVINGGAIDNTIGANANLTYTATAAKSGTAGNLIQISYVNNGLNQTLAIDPTSTTTNIIVDLGTNSLGSVSSTAAQILALINGNATANASVVATYSNGANTGAGFVTPMATTTLSGGTAGGSLANLTTALGVNATMVGNFPIQINNGFSYLGTATSLNMGTPTPATNTTTVSTDSLIYSAVNYGTAGNTITINYVTAGSFTSPTVASVVGNVITVDLGITLTNNTPANISTAFTSTDSGAAAALVSLNTTTSTGTVATGTTSILADGTANGVLVTLAKTRLKLHAHNKIRDVQMGTTTRCRRNLGPQQTYQTNQYPLP
jgi:fibronectin-binding autotransporter adhesin